MADHLTQLQQSLHELSVQMFASLNYVSEHHANADIPGQQYHGPLGKEYEPKPTITNGVTHDANGRMEQIGPAAEETRNADDPASFTPALREMARDIVAKEQEIESLIRTLPGKDQTRGQQEQRMAELNEKLQAVDHEMEKASREKQEMLKAVESAILKINRYPG